MMGARAERGTGQFKGEENRRTTVIWSTLQTGLRTGRAARGQNKVYNFSEKIQFNYYVAYIVIWSLEGGRFFPTPGDRALAALRADGPRDRGVAQPRVARPLPTPDVSARRRAPDFIRMGEKFFPLRFVQRCGIAIAQTVDAQSARLPDLERYSAVAFSSKLSF